MTKEYPNKCHNCGHTWLKLCRDNGMSTTYYNIIDGELGDYIFSNNNMSGSPKEYIFCEGCMKVVFELKITKKWLMKYKQLSIYNAKDII